MSFLTKRGCLVFIVYGLWLVNAVCSHPALGKRRFHLLGGRRQHRGTVNESLLGCHFFFSFELPYLKTSKKAHLVTDLNAY
jgi:hypothetical protein